MGDVMAGFGDGALVRDRADIPAADADPVSHAAALTDAQTIAMVRAALETKRLRLAYQPIFSARNVQKPIFYEGLIRVLDPTGRVIPARDFIAAVETQDIGRLIDCAALELGLGVLLRNPGIRLSLNMSARSVGYPRWMTTLRRGLKAGPGIGERLILEIAETSVNLVPELVAEFMRGLQIEGVSFALDGFGAGFTAFRHFRDFPFDILKIDGQFIRGLTTNPDNQILVRSFAQIARNFDLLTVAESVETPAEAEILGKLGIDALQGYLLGAPTVRPDFLDRAQRKTA
jgi:EAL domain-containing protein (putative c-di-GMP-specific phosphodiesterase class I)